MKRFVGQCVDLGNWNSLTAVMEENAVGDVKYNDKCESRKNKGSDLIRKE